MWRERIAAGLLVLVAASTVACSDDSDDSDDSSLGGSSGLGGGTVAGSGGTSGSGGGAAGNGGTNTAGSGGSAGVGQGGAGTGGGAGATGNPDVDETAEACGAPRSVTMAAGTAGGSDDSKWATLRWDLDELTCSFVPGDEIVEDGMLVLQRDASGAYSIYAQSPWDWEYGPGIDETAPLPVDTDLLILPSNEELGVELEVTLRFSGDQVTLVQIGAAGG